jgi:hypothetical protein
LDKERRNNLRKVIHECRKLLEDEITKRLAYYGIMADGQFLDLAKLPHLTDQEWETRRRLEQAIEKEALGKLTKSEAVKRYIHHVGFTYLNRFAALRAMEVRGLLKKETIIRRDEYGGRSLRERDIAESDPHLTPEQVLKESLIEAFQEVGEEIKVLFDMNNEYSLVFPETRACLELIRLLTEEVTEEDWKQDDVIGWIYQYFNSEARKEFRKARRKPEADDIPVINQFYTPDWIVKALVDNTLGRLWLEMHPDSKIKEFCTYLVPLKEKPPKREIKRVRDIKVLDPACGSGHFLVYAFDVLYQMYLEDEPETPPSEVPALILENNLFGIDIDLRSVQLAALSLYLKAKTRSRSLKIRRMNLVCADIRIADSEQRLEFLKRFEDDPALQRIFARLFEELEYTYEIGSLLKVRVPFERLFQERASEKGRQARLSLPLTGQVKLGVKGLAGQTKFEFGKSPKSSEGQLTIVIPKERTIEEMLDELRSFERESIEAQDMGRLLFATEAEKSVGLLSLLSQKYDVVVMNPPYGDMPESTKNYAKKYYPRTYYDYYAAFIEQAVELGERNGLIGMLTGRTFMFLQRLEKIRTEILLEYARPEVLFDLNLTPADNILDEATARWAATVVRKIRDENEKTTCVFIRLTLFQGEQEKIKGLENALRVWLEKGKHEIFYPVKLQSLKKLPRMPYSYWVPYSLIELFKKHPPLDKDHTNNPDQLKVADLVVGLKTGDNNRFCRYFWEVANETLGKGKKWVPFAKGVDRFCSNIDVVVNWEKNGQEIKEFPKSSVANEDYYFHQGLHWPNIASSISLNFSVLPKNTIISNATRGLFPSNKKHTMALLAIGNSKLSSFLYVALDPLMHNRDLGYVTFIPISKEALENKEIKALAEEAYCIIREWNTGNEVSIEFIKPWLLQTLHGFNSSERPITQHPLAQQFEWSDWPILKKTREISGSSGMSLRELAELCLKRQQILRKRLEEIQKEIDEEVYRIYGVSKEDRDLIERELGLIQGNVEKERQTTDKAQILEHIERMLSYYVKRAIESDEDGIVPFDEMFPDNLINKVRQQIADDFGTDNVDRVEQELYQLLGKNLKEWLAQEYFDFHVSLYKNRPIFWQLVSYRSGNSRSPPGVFSCFVHYHRLTRVETISKIRAFYLERVKEALAREKEHLLRVLEAARATGDGPRINRLSKVYEDTLSKIDELERFEDALITLNNPRKDKKVLPKNARWVDRAIAEVRDNGWNPIIDYGVRVNIEPLKEAKLLHPAADRVK